jgi:hypothetical protein
MSPELQQSTKEFLLAEEVKRPDILGEINGVESAVSFRWRGEKSKKRPLALASDLKNYTNVTAPTTATEGTGGLDNVTLQKLKHSPSVATQPSL